MNNEHEIVGGILGIHFYGLNHWKGVNWFSKSCGEEEEEEEAAAPAARS